MNSIISMNKTKLFLKKDSMTGTTKFSFMKHLPTHQPNRSRFAMVFLLFMTFLLGSVQGWGQITQTFEYTGSNQTFIVPDGVTSITVECWGAGAAGSNAGIASGGGGGGAYTKGTLTGLISGNSLTIIVGAGGTVSATQATTDGGNSSVSTIVANGGKTVVNSRNGGAGGAASAITGAVTASYAGGAGGTGRSSTAGSNNEAGGGGGGSALTTGNGSNGGNGGSSTSSVTAGGSGTGAGGGGAAGDGSPDAQAGNVPGGGGGGRGEGTSTSKSGAHGRVVITYTCSSNVTPSVTISSDAASNTICSGTSVTFTATPTNGGSAPTYQWKLNGTNVGTSSTTYSNSALANSDVVTVVMTANNVCQTASTATSSGITMTVNTVPLAPAGFAQLLGFGSTVDDLVATGTSLQWYSASTGGSALALTTSLSTVTYYASQTVGSCESARTAVPVVVGSAGGSIITSTAGTYSFSAPSFVKGLKVETWGAGGGGGGFSRASGGGGGAYARSYLTNSGNAYNTIVGAGGTGGLANAAGVDGGNTIFGSSLVVAEGGKKGTNGNNSTPSTGVGGGTTNSVGTVEFSGGTGGLGRSGGSTGRGGGGGSSAGTASNGNNGGQGGSAAGTAGTAVAGGGAGGIGGSTDIGGNGSIPGGGGGGASDGTGATGGNGGNGQIRLTYVDISNLTVASTPIVVCNNSTATITLNSTSLANGNYYVYYSTTWGGTTTVQSKVYMTFNSGTTAGMFTTVALPNAGSYTITITRIENSSETDIYSEPTSALTKSVTVRTAFTSGTISSTGETICSGGTPSVIGNTTASSGGDDVITYSWRSSADSYVAEISNATSSTYTPPSGLTATTSYRRYANDGTCNTTATVSTGTWTVTVNPNLPASVSISASATTICSGTSVTFTATPTNGGTTPTYVWKKNGTIISGATASTYATTALVNGDVITCVMTSNATPCLTGSPATSNGVTMVVNPVLTASVSIAANATTICSGTSVTFTATPTNGGTTPSYQWKVNGTNAGTNSATYTSTTLANNDAVTCVMTSNATPCLAGSPATSNSISMTVNPILTASVSISASATGICSGNSITLTAVATNGGNSPAFVWKKNGVLVSGQNNATFASGSFANGDVITCEMTSNASPCLAGSPATSNSVTITVNPIVTPTFTQVSAICAGASLNALPTTSNNSITGTWSPSLNNTATTTYTFTPTAGQCASTASMTITVNPIVTPMFTPVSAICSGASLSALPTTSNNSITGTWSPALNNAATTTYTFTPTAGQCASTASMTITVNPIVTPTFTQVAAICSGATLNALPTTSNNSITGTWSPAVNNTATTTYTFTPTAGFCASSASATITVNALPTATITAGSATTFCQGGNVVLTASAGTSYLWSNGATTSSITVSVSGSFTVTVTNANGCSATSSATAVTVTTPTLTYYIDADHDGFGAGTASNYCTSQGAGYSTVNTDCNDANVSISPMAEELCDGIDNDCNASTADGLGTTTYFRDADNDGFGNLNITSVSCQSPSGYVANATDCDDNNAAYHTINTYFEDADGDTFGNGDVAQNACFLTTGYSVNHEDCDDTNAEVNPNATEVCNLIDDDCDGVINDGLTSIDYHLDADHDGYGSATVAPMCAALPGYVTNSADCDDNNPNVNPSALEICGNTVDEDCIGGDLVPSYYTSRQSGPWTTPSTWNKSCDNTTYNLAAYAPQENYAGIVTIAASHAVTVGTTDAYVASAGNLNINATGSVIVNGKMSVSQSLVNNGTLTVNNGASFLQSSTTGANTGSGNYVVNMTLSGTNNGSAPNGRYWYIGSPMNNTNIYNTFYNTTTMTRIWDYLPATNAWNAIINSSTGVGVNSATNMAVGIGYLYRAGSAQSVTFNGTSSTFNNNITTPLEFTGVGYKYVANPYTSHVDWKQVTRTGLNVSYWIRNAANTSYESYNATSGLSTNNISGLTNQYIPPMQGFWIYAYTTPCSLRMDNGDRVHAGNALHAPMHNQVVRLNLNDGKTDDQALVYENENASNGIEEFDTDKFMDENHHQVYFLEGTKEVSMDGLKDATAKQRVDMGIQITAAGTYTINAVELGVEEDVVLEDKFTHTFQDLKRNSSYSFTANAGTFNNRFVLHFTLNPQTETAMETVEVTETVGETEGVSVYTTTGQQVKVWVTNTTDFQNATVKVYDSVGNMIERKNMTSSELLLDLNTATGVYLVEVTGTEKVFTKKIFITK